jgi:hypothetical protein
MSERHPPDRELARECRDRPGRERKPGRNDNAGIGNQRTGAAVPVAATRGIWSLKIVSDIALGLNRECVGAGVPGRDANVGRRRMPDKAG